MDRTQTDRYRDNVLKQKTNKTGVGTFSYTDKIGKAETGPQTVRKDIPIERERCTY